MARQLFIDDRLNEYCSALVYENESSEQGDFWEKVFLPIEALVREEIRKAPVSIETLNSLYFIGSFSRGMAGLQSDVDLLCLSKDQNEVAKLNETLRKKLRNYSLKQVSSISEFVKVSDAKGLLSGWFLKPVFDGEDLKLKMRKAISESRLDEIENFLDEESKTRYKRYGERAGRINYNIKYSPGGLLDLMQLGWRSSALKEILEVDDYAFFLYKARAIFHIYSNSEVLQLSDVKKYMKSFGLHKEQEFFKKFYSAVNGIAVLLEAKKKIKTKYTLKSLLQNVASIEEIAHAEVELSKVRGLVLSPSYHVWTVDQHILSCIARVQDFIEDYEVELSLTEEEKVILQWAAYFHDLKKGEEESHSVLGAKAVQAFGSLHKWDAAQTELISWLVREHLTLVKHAFKMDPFHPDFVKTLTLRGCEGRRAVMLFVLSCADIKATNPSTWNEWKRGMLKKALDQVLGIRETIKDKLVEDLSKSGEEAEHQKALMILEKLSLKEICMVPFELLSKDLKSLSGRTSTDVDFSFYELDGRYWVRAYLDSDEFGFAEKFMESLQLAGAYIHHAVFKTFTQTGGVYNWVCVESGASFTAFQNRFKHAFKNYKAGKLAETTDTICFRAIRKTFLGENYAVISFKGLDHAGALVSAVRTLKDAGLNIEWGHAVTWGEEIEEVFGVSFSADPDWSFLSAK